jgi:hypothetical protein
LFREYRKSCHQSICCHIRTRIICIISTKFGTLWDPIATQFQTEHEDDDDEEEKNLNNENDEETKLKSPQQIWRERLQILKTYSQNIKNEHYIPERLDSKYFVNDQLIWRRWTSLSDSLRKQKYNIEVEIIHIDLFYLILICYLIC